MSRRIAHRPRYRTIHQLVHISQCARRDFFTKHWAYRHQHTEFKKRSLGYGLSFIPVTYRLVQGVLVR
jgi:hypothetical protein